MCWCLGMMSALFRIGHPSYRKPLYIYRHTPRRFFLVRHFDMYMRVRPCENYQCYVSWYKVGFRKDVNCRSNYLFSCENIGNYLSFLQSFFL